MASTYWEANSGTSNTYPGPMASPSSLVMQRFLHIWSLELRWNKHQRGVAVDSYVQPAWYLRDWFSSARDRDLMRCPQVGCGGAGTACCRILRSSSAATAQALRPWPRRSWMAACRCRSGPPSGQRAAARARRGPRSPAPHLWCRCYRAARCAGTDGAAQRRARRSRRGCATGASAAVLQSVSWPAGDRRQAGLSASQDSIWSIHGGAPGIAAACGASTLCGRYGAPAERAVTGRTAARAAATARRSQAGGRARGLRRARRRGCRRCAEPPRRCKR